LFMIPCATVLPLFPYTTLFRSYSISLKRQMVLPKKVYFIDHALAKLVGFRHTEDRGRLLENQVFIELKRRGLDVYYHKEEEECRSEEHTSELQSRENLVCRLLL